MPKINLNQSPYFDDYNENKKFYKILFRPGRAVQARELTQIQTAIQTQIERMGKHIFQEGAQVLPGSKEGVRYINNNQFIKIKREDNADSAAELDAYWLGKEIISTSGLTGIKGIVIGYNVPDTLDEARLYVNYYNADGTGAGTSFLPGQNISTVEAVPVIATIRPNNNSVGFISSVICEDSVYFFNGNFILVDKQQLFLKPADETDQDAWTNSPTAICGLQVTESIVTSDDDESILDNAIGSPNYAAPGADRLHISADFITALTDNGSDFIPLMTIVNGEVRARVVKTELSILGDTLARRTNDESGDYTVLPFQIQIRDFLRNEANDGIHPESDFYYESQPDAEQASIDIFGLPSPGQAYLYPLVNKYIPGSSYDDNGSDTSFIQLCNNKLSIKVDPGKAYVKGYEIEKAVTNIVDFDKSRTLKFRDNKRIPTPLGTYIQVKDLSGALTVNTYDTIELYSEINSSPGTAPTLANKIGTARVLAIDFVEGINGTSSAIYNVFLFNIKVDAGKDLGQLKSIYSSSPSMTANLKLATFRLSGSVSVGTSPASITIAGTTYFGYLRGTGTSWKNDELQRLKEGDYIQVGQGTTSNTYRIAKNPANDNELAISTLVLGGVLFAPGSTIDFVYALPKTNSDESGLVYRLPDAFVNTLRGGEQGTINTAVYPTHFSARRMVGVAHGRTGNTLLFTIGAINEAFENFSSAGYSVVRSDGEWLEAVPYSFGTPLPGTVEVEPNGSNLTIYLNAADVAAFPASTYYVIASIVKSNAQERSKTFIKGRFVLGIYEAGKPFVESTGSGVSQLSLGKADVLRITRVVQAPDFATTPSDLEVLPPGHTDVTGLYLLDDGQRDHYYDIAKVILRPGFDRNSIKGKIRVEFDYFEHGPTGSFFSVDSYPVKGPLKSMDYEEIPFFTSSGGTVYDLASSIDFRPRVSTGGIDSGFATSIELPKEAVFCDYHFYESRIDKLYLDINTKFLIKKGNPDVNPSPPDDPDSGMVIYTLNIDPYTALPESVRPVLRDNKRYTMRDIGKLEKRIKTLEYYTSLSMLETNTRDLVIKDAQGNDKFKNGFFVDNFGSFDGSDLNSSDYKASLDRTSGEVRPLIYECAVPLSEKILLAPTNSRDTLRAGAGYKKTGDLYTLPYTTVKMTEQTKASKVANINPYSVFAFIGAVKITPWSDEWRETKDIAPLDVLDSGAYDLAKHNYPTGTNIDYTQTTQLFTGTNTSTVETGERVLLISGHANRKDITDEQKMGLKKENGFDVVSPGYVNSGQLVPHGKRNWYAAQTKTTTTLTGSEITTAFTSTFEDGPNTPKVSLGTRVVDISAAEFMRSKYVEFEAKAFMPGAKLYAFFDGVDVTEDCMPIPFLADGSNCIYGLPKDNVANDLRFEAGKGAPLICDSRGRVSGTFLIPNIKTDKKTKRFKTGDRVFRLTTSPTNSINPQPASAGNQNFTARGWIDTKQETTYSTRTFNIKHDSHVEGTKPLEWVTSVTFGQGDPCPSDPLAQSFFVYDKGGCFITAVDIFFYKKPPNDGTQPPVKLQIRTLDEGGNPSSKVLPFGEVIKEGVEVITNHINLTTGQLTVTGYDGSDPKTPSTPENSGPWGLITSGVPFTYGSSPQDQMVPTRFTFESPIYLAENKSFAIVLISDSNLYNVWVAQSGPSIAAQDALGALDKFTTVDGEVNTEVGTKKPILIDPYPQGILFKSQNGISWTPDQTTDMKFKIWKAEFDTSVSGEMDFVNNELPLAQLTTDAFQTVSGQSLVRVLHPNHGLTRGTPPSKVVFSPEYNVLLPGTFSSSGVTVTGSTSFSGLLAIDGFIRHPITREQRKIVGIPNATSVTIASAFTVALSDNTGVLGTNYAVPSGTPNLAGIDSSTLFNSAGFDVLVTELDYYIIDVGTVATSSSRVGGPKMFASENKRFEELMLLTTPLEVTGTKIIWNVQTTSSCGVNDSVNLPYKLQPRKNLAPNEKLIFDKPQHVSSYINELSPPSPVVTVGLGDKKSLNIKAVLKSDNKNLSPIIDSSRMSAYLVTQRLDNPHGIAGDGVDPNSIINSIYDNLVLLPSPVVEPVVASTAGKFYFTTSTGALTGTANGTLNTKTVTGTGTAFLSELKVGDIIKETANNQERRVTAITSDTALTVDINWAFSFAGVLHINPPYIKIKTGDPDCAAHISKLDIGKYLSISGAANTNRNFSDVLILDVEYNPFNTVADPNLPASAPKLAEITVERRSLVAASLEANSITFTQKDRFIDEIAPQGGSVGAKYVTKKLALPRPSNALKILFDAHRHESVTIELYYKLEPVNSTKTIDQLNWIKAEFNIDNDGNIVADIPNANAADNEFGAYESINTALPDFIGAQAKVVMRGGNPARCPRVKNFRLIALDE